MLHDDLTPQTNYIVKMNFYCILKKVIEIAYTGKCEQRAFLNHIRYFIEDTYTLSQMGMDI